MKGCKSKLMLLLFTTFVLVTFTHSSCEKEPDPKDALIVGGPEETWVSYKFGDEGPVNRVTSVDSLRVMPDYSIGGVTGARWRLTNNKLEEKRTMCDLQFDSRGTDRFSFDFYWEPVAGADGFISGQSYNLYSFIQSGNSVTVMKPTWGLFYFDHSYPGAFSNGFNIVKLTDSQGPYSRIEIEEIKYNTAVSPAVKSHVSGKFYIAHWCPGSNTLLTVHGRFNKVPLADGSDDSKNYVSFGRGNLQGSICREDGFAGNSHPTRTIQVIYEKIIGTKVEKWVAYPKPRDREWLGCSNGVGYRLVSARYNY